MTSLPKDPIQEPLFATSRDRRRKLFGTREHFFCGHRFDGKTKGDQVSYTAPNGKELSVTIVDAEPYRA